ncbi:PAAR domain-containing protein [Variovorax sp. OV329]|uniref:PAAR domain-containing protein n=1 Tax=Variovorax sp. OV329 TaxID=1882825 RepID=UPI0008F41943|nr:PAAR domain-containing protein [Variovorax sp. OV329]SFM41532.1 Zn-binding Pro-Ala-Ala-Arg (PAAR) domain-containing protein, incolved in TypeVI secretion [Variovorax sp. OV329]
MRDEHGRPAVRLGDTTDHGGEVITALDIHVHGRRVAAQDCLTRCPRCGGEFRIIPRLSGARHKGRILAFDGDLTECGAKLISSLRT